MFISKFILFAALYLVPLPSVAVEGSALVLSLICTNPRSCHEDQNQWQKQLQWQCELEVKSLECETLAQQRPEWAPYLRRCDLQSQCRELAEFHKNKSKACLRGYKNALIDLGMSLKNGAQSLASMVEQSWDHIKTNHRLRSQFLKECENSLACKKDLVKDDPRYNRLSDEKLNSLSAVFLDTEVRELKSYKSSLDRARPPTPVPLSERFADDTSDSALSQEQNEKLQNLLRIARHQIQEQYQRYSCYTPEFKEELECYAVAMVLDPLKVGAYFLKGARSSLAVAKKAPFKIRISRADLTGRYLNYSPTTVAQNEKWIAIAEKGRSDKTTFLDIENSQMKSLNDTLKDKNLVTGMTNLHKEILFDKIKDLESRNPGLVIDPYSDFKSTRFAFSGKIPPDLERQLQNIFKETNEELSEALKSVGVLKNSDQPEWFRAGIGSSADQANLAARHSRQLETNDLQTFQRPSLQDTLKKQLTEIEAKRLRLRQEVAGTSMMEGNTFHQDVFDIVRKGKGDTAQVTESLKKRFALEKLSSKTVENLESYMRATDEFSPGIYIAKREIAHLNNASQGGLSADMIGMGAANLKGTAEALATSSGIEETLKATRSAEKSVTKHFKAQKDFFEKVLSRSVEPGKLKSLCSGDDCVAVATKPLSEAEKRTILKGLADSPYSGNYRLAFIPDGVQIETTRNALATHGESLEKILRQSLSSAMGPRKLKGLTFAVDMRTQQLNLGGLKLLMGEAPGVRLSKQERALIHKQFQEAVRKFNQEARDQGEKAAYYALP